MKNRQIRNRGYLLLDTLIVMTVTVTVLSMSSVWIYKTLCYSSEIDHRVQHVRSISRVGHQLRGDALGAISISVKGTVLRLKSDRRNIRYEIKGNRLKRQAEESLAGSATLHRDDFEFAPNAVLRWQPLSGNAIRLIIRRDFSHLAPGKDKTERNVDSQIRVSVIGESHE